MGREPATARGPARQVAVAALGLGIAATLLVHLAWRAGGYFPPDYLQAAAVAAFATGLLLVVAPPRWRLSSQALVAVGALAALAAWTGLSATWAPAPYRAVQAAQRDLLYLALFALALLAAGSGRHARLIPWVGLAVASIVVGAGLLSRLEPDLIAAPALAPGLSDGRLAYPLGYWNAFGALAAMLVVLSAGLAGDPRTPVVARAVTAGISLLAFVAMYLSLSRGAWLALIAGAVVLLLGAARRGSMLLTGGLIAAAGVLAVSRLQAYPELTGSSADAPHPAAGHRFAAQLAVLAALLVGAQALIAAGRASTRLMAVTAPAARRVLAAGAIVVVVGALGAYAVRSRSAEGHAANALRDSSGFVSRQWRDFMRPAVQAEGGTGRLTTAKGTRSGLYRVAIDGFEAHPLRGDGAGGFEVRWARTRRVDEDVRNAHSLELETLGELGAVGAALLVAFLGSIVVTAVRSRLRPGGLGRGRTTAVAAALAVWLVHSSVDWDWQMPALTGTALLLAAPLFPYGRVRRRRTPRDEDLFEDEPVAWSRVGAWRGAPARGRP